jgi:hypothetical protein
MSDARLMMQRGNAESIYKQQRQRRNQSGFREASEQVKHRALQSCRRHGRTPSRGRHSNFARRKRAIANKIGVHKKSIKQAVLCRAYAASCDFVSMLYAVSAHKGRRRDEGGASTQETPERVVTQVQHKSAALMRHFLIGPDGGGHWLVCDAEGTCGAVFVNR